AWPLVLAAAAAAADLCLLGLMLHLSLEESFLVTRVWYLRFFSSLGSSPSIEHGIHPSPDSAPTDADAIQERRPGSSNYSHRCTATSFRSSPQLDDHPNDWR